MAAVFQRSCDHGSGGDPGAVTVRVATLTDAESQQVLQCLAGFSPAAVDMAISAVTRHSAAWPERGRVVAYRN
jgi:hypothetical protein